MDTTATANILKSVNLKLNKTSSRVNELNLTELILEIGTK